MEISKIQNKNNFFIDKGYEIYVNESRFFYAF